MRAAVGVRSAARELRRLGDLAQRLGRLLRGDDAVLQGIDPIRQPVEQREVAVDRGVEDGVQHGANRPSHCAGTLAEAAGYVLDRRRRTPVHADELLCRGEQVQLAEVDSRAALPRAANLVGDQHVLPRVGVDLRPLAPLANVLDGQRMELELALEEGRKAPQCLANIDMNILSLPTSEFPDASCCYSFGGQTDR